MCIIDNYGLKSGANIVKINGIDLNASPSHLYKYYHSGIKE